MIIMGRRLSSGQASENLRRAAVEMKAEELQKALGGLGGFQGLGFKVELWKP